MSSEYEQLMQKEHAYPSPSDEDFQKKIYEKREFYYHKKPHRKILGTYEEKAEHRDGICAGDRAPLEHQAFLGNFINPDTPYRGLLIFHGTGTGKCMLPETQVYVNNQLVRLDDIWKQNMTISVPDQTVRYAEWSVPKVPLWVNSWTNDRMVQASVGQLYRQHVNEFIKVITFVDGTELRITQQHQLLTPTGWTNNLTKGQVVAQPNKYLHNPINVNNAYLTLIAHQIGNGFEICTKPIIQLSFHPDLAQLFHELPIKLQTYMTEPICEDMQCLQIESKEYYNFLILHNYRWACQPSEKVLPDFVMQSSFDQIHYFLTLFLKLYWTENNGVWQGQNQSWPLMRQLQILFGILGMDLQLHRQGHHIIGRVKDTLLDTPPTKYLEIANITFEKYEGFVYDLEIPTWHNYVAENIICHNTCAAITIAEKFKPMVEKYNTKIYVLYPGPINRETWRDELMTCPGETYMRSHDKSVYLDEETKNMERKAALKQISEYYHFMSYQTFHKKVIGEKIRETVMQGNRERMAFRKTADGKVERELAMDPISNLNNTILIVDEAHNLTGNDRGEALKKVIRNSVNLRILLLTATPMKNLASEIVEMLNYLRPADSQIVRDRVFNSYTNHLMDFREGGIDYLMKMASGYVSFLRGADPITFAERVDMGVIPAGLQFIPVIQCKMEPFQQRTYMEAVKDTSDTLEKSSGAVANFAFPGLSQDRKQIQGYYAREGISIISNQLKSDSELLNRRIQEELFKDDESGGDWVYLSDQKILTGKFLQYEYLKNFSIKFYKALGYINELVVGKRGPGTAFVYSNLVKVGIEMFKEVLVQNGYLEYHENYANYTITGSTICYYCGQTHKVHQTVTQDHTFYPATFVVVTGKTEDATEPLPDEKMRVIRGVFNHIDNRYGKYVKLILGSKVMNEGVTLQNCREVHILDVHYNLGRTDQVLGRAIRHCVHYNITNKDNPNPKVEIYRYVVSMEGQLSSEEEMYRKAELKYQLVKRVEDGLKQVAIDCPLNYHGNIFPEELERYKDCGMPGKPKCPAVCGYGSCHYKCHNKALNLEYYDPNRGIYKKIAKSDLDYSTFNDTLARHEINHAKEKIKEMYRLKQEYELGDIMEYVKNSYYGEKRELFDDFFVFKGLDELIPLTENDFNNYHDTIFDKHNTPGYLIYRDKYYIFQPFGEKEDVPMYYRQTYQKPLLHKLSVYNYMKNTNAYQDYVKDSDQVEPGDVFRDEFAYDFESVQEYYDDKNRNEFAYVGIIDREPSRRKALHPDDVKDVFKLRQKRDKILEKKRGTGIASWKGAVCRTSRDRDFLLDVIKKLGMDVKKHKHTTREKLCSIIKDELLRREKYGTTKNKDKMTYMIIPRNHAMYPFPYNLEDRVKFINREISDKIKIKLDIQSDKIVKKNEPPKYKITIKGAERLGEHAELLTNLGGQKVKNTWVFEVA